MKTLLKVLCLCVCLQSYALDSTLRVGILAFDAPFVLQAGQNQFYGFDIATMNFICQYMNKSCQFIPLSRKEIYQQLTQGGIDVAISAFVLSPPIQEFLGFSLPYMTSEAQFITHATIPQKTVSNDTLYHKRIGVISYSAYAKQLKTMNIQAEIKYFDNDTNIIAALQNNDIDFGLVNYYSALYWQHNASDSIKLIGNRIPIGFGLSVLINKTHQDMVQSINAAIYNYQNSALFKENFDTYLGGL